MSSNSVPTTYTKRHRSWSILMAAERNLTFTPIVRSCRKGLHEPSCLINKRRTHLRHTRTLDQWAHCYVTRHAVAESMRLLLLIVRSQQLPPPSRLLPLLFNPKVSTPSQRPSKQTNVGIQSMFESLLRLDLLNWIKIVVFSTDQLCINTAGSLLSDQVTKLGVSEQNSHLGRAEDFHPDTHKCIRANSYAMHRE